MHGRLENGEAPVQLSNEEVMVEQKAAPPSQRLLGSVIPLVDAAAASGADTGRATASMFAFNTFGQAVALFQNIQVLVGAGQPVEALPALRGLVILAARFEQMTDPAAATIARSRCVCSAAVTASTSVGARIRGSRRLSWVSGTPWPGRSRSRRVGSPAGTGLAATSPRACR